MQGIITQTDSLVILCDIPIPDGILLFRCSDEPDYKKSAGSLESETKPLGESDEDSMLEYEETDPTKFNEDGSFIGQYGGKTKKEEKMEPDATSPSALSTFV